MTIQLVPAEPSHLKPLARICHRAFDTLHERHRIHRDVPAEEVGELIIGAVLHRPDYVGVVAVEDGRVLGSNFLLMADEVWGVGPITVDPETQSKGVGRLLMRWVIDEATRRQGRPRVRLFQEAVNATSLSLYTSLGFSWRDAAAVMRPAVATTNDPSVRPMTADDQPHVHWLSVKHHGHTRAGDAARLLEMGLPAMVRERGGRVVGYQIASLFGHGAGETVDDVLVLASQLAKVAPEPMSVIIVPLSQDALFRAALGAGFRVLKVVNSMSIGADERSPGPCTPSIQC